MNYSNSNLNTLGFGDGKVMDDTIGCDGEIIHYEATSASQNVGNYNEDFFSANGEEDDEYYNAIGEEDDEYYNAGGLWANFKKNQKIRQKRRSDRSKSKGDARKTKANAKLGLADAQKISAKASDKGVGADIAMANALASSAPAPDVTPAGMSKGLKIGLIVGGVVILGIVGFFIYKKMSKKG